MAATFLVIGLGRFGSSLALRLMEYGNEVMVIDSREEEVNRIAPYVTQAKIGDCMALTSALCASASSSSPPWRSPLF